MRQDVSVTLVLGLEMTAGSVGNVFESALELAVVLGLVGDLDLVVLEDVDVVVDLSVGKDGAVLDGKYDLVFEFVETVCDFNFAIHLINYKRSA